tara:strand:+ start:250 stop:729 length:480 start_codon:yes stop_codon:yes gene_type:complete
MINLFLSIKKEIESKGYYVVGCDFNRPWGGFLLIDEIQSTQFIKEFISTEIIKIEGRVSPKILIINPNSRLSWQYHYRRKEIWKIYRNKVGIIRSKTNFEEDMCIYNEGDFIKFDQEERHRLIGLSKPGIVAEIWIHTDINNPSDEKDIIRIQDDYSRG